jgi:D-threonate/D-erythronate kinase
MSERWLIVADDLTGAADSAIAFAKRRLSTRVVWGDARPEPHADVFALSFDVASRALDPASAARRHVNVLHRCVGGRSRVYKKIDSTLRGHPAAEIAAMLDVLGARESVDRAVLAPAFPAGGRTTRAGRVFVHGVPLEFTEFWPEGRDPARAGLIPLLEDAGLHAHLVPLELVRGPPEKLAAALGPRDPARGPSVAVCDAETEADLDRIAAATPRSSTFCIGSGGFVNSLAGIESRDGAARTATLRRAPASNGALIVVGSQASASRAALAELARLPNTRRISVDPRDDRPTLLDQAVLSDLARTLVGGGDVIVDLASPEDPASLRPAAVSALARELAPLAASASALGATGGDTAAALCARWGITGITLVDEVEPGMSLGVTLGAVSVPLVTKSGGFGDRGSLTRLTERLRFIRQTGTVA